MTTTSSHFLGLPQTRPGWWSVGLAAANVVFMLSWSFLPGGAALGFLCGLAAGVAGLIAIIRRQERSWLVFVSILPMLGVFAFLIGEFMFPH